MIMLGTELLVLLELLVTAVEVRVVELIKEGENKLFIQGCVHLRVHSPCRRGIFSGNARCAEAEITS